MNQIGRLQLHFKIKIKIANTGAIWSTGSLMMGACAVKGAHLSAGDEMHSVPSETAWRGRNRFDLRGNGGREHQWRHFHAEKYI